MNNKKLNQKKMGFGKIQRIEEIIINWKIDSNSVKPQENEFD